MRPEEIYDRITKEPFKPLRVHVSDGTTIDVPNPRGVIVGHTSSVFVDEWGPDRLGKPMSLHWRMIDNSHITQLIDLRGRRNGNGRRAK